MPKRKATLEDSFWDIPDSHPDFILLPRSEQRWAYEEVVDSIVNADVRRPLSFEDARAKMDHILAELGLRPLAEAQEAHGKLLVEQAAALHDELNIFRAQPDREKLVHHGVYNPEKLVQLQENSFRAGWDLALQYAQGKIFEVFELEEIGDEPEATPAEASTEGCAR